MKPILIGALIAIAIAQFSVPDFGQIGESIKNEASKVEETIQNFAKEEIHNAGEVINEGLEYITGSGQQSAPAENKPAEAQKENPTAEILISGAPKSIPLNTVETSAAILPAPVAAVVQVETVVAPVIAEKPTPQPQLSNEEKPKPKEHKKSHIRQGKPRREEDASDDIEVRRKPEKHDRKDKHQYSPEELQQKREERQRRIKQKEERRNSIERKHRNIESESESKSGDDWKRHEQRIQKEHRHKKEQPEISILPPIDEPKFVTKLTVNHP